ncbi:hypothetical protein ASPACDRAFT_74132 [Aspergillus aculeatus ATCC 16872]|uniref:Uncharacterized protein n=1 Tax=Aspergillus aculeatus (strain ATCC 16872 / CBS 172.66 / WB 5094) TaxID=690307 RepID=A0A1L9X7T2_ASPA1|nr:uncharacterized protein ASPACDRAFT_74132 [Aspergillus aculeatus ATCC 16872]OJK04497.1 hypothetical protein ASPACDRAFT_74132 [Aspergillus aculeatus ATCC 16872]
MAVMDDRAPLLDTMVYPQAFTILFPVIPASLRRRLPSLYSTIQRSVSSGVAPNFKASTTGEQPSASMHSRMPSSSIPELECYKTLPDPLTGDIFPRPATVDSSSNERDSCVSSVSGKAPDMSEITAFEEGRYGDSFGVPSSSRYEAESGLRWNRVIPALSLLRNAGYEAQLPRCDGPLARSLYITALGYLLDALPAELTHEEIATIRRNLPSSLQSSTLVPGDASQPATGLMSSDAEPDTYHRSNKSRRSLLHRLLAFVIIQVFLLVRYVVPYLKLLLARVYQYERSHRVAERVISTTLDTVDSWGKRSMSFGSTILGLYEGRVRSTVINITDWWVEGIAGGIYEGVGEGMTVLGLIQPHAKLERASIQALKRRL